MANGPPWTVEQIAVLRTGWADSLTDAAIGRRIGRSAASVARKATDLRLGARPGPLVDPDEATADLPDDQPKGYAPRFSVGRALAQHATVGFLIAFKRSGYTAAYYKAKCEISDEEDRRERRALGRQPRVSGSGGYERSWIGSPAALCAV